MACCGYGDMLLIRLFGECGLFHFSKHISTRVSRAGRAEYPCNKIIATSIAFPLMGTPRKEGTNANQCQCPPPISSYLGIGCLRLCCVTIHACGWPRCVVSCVGIRARVYPLHLRYSKDQNRGFRPNFGFMLMHAHACIPAYSFFFHSIPAQPRPKPGPIWAWAQAGPRRNPASS